MNPDDWRELKRLCRDLMRKREWERAQCTGKPSFDNRVDASRAASHNRHLKIYRCNCCNRWHVGNFDQRRKLDRMQRAFKSREMR